MEAPDTLLLSNRSWVASIEASEPGFFKSLSLQQAPQYFWIGCADSRVSANELVGLRPGELFVHGNVENVVSPSDLNSLACLQYANASKLARVRLSSRADECERFHNRRNGNHSD